MIVRELKLRPNKEQDAIFSKWLWVLTGVYNFGIKKIEKGSLNPATWKHYTRLELVNLCANHSKRLEIPSHCVQGVLTRAYDAWSRYWAGLGGKPKLKGIRNKLKSIPFPDPIPESKFSEGKISLPGIGRVRYHKQKLPAGKIKNGRIIKRSSGWHLQLVIDATNTFKVQNTKKSVGIDTGFKHLAVLSDGTKIENQRNFIQDQERLAQAQRGHDKKLASRLHERISNRRKNHNHKISRKIVENYDEIYITKDNLKGQQKKFGKSVGDAGIRQLRNFISYKSDNHGRKCVFVDSFNTTKTCSACMSLTGPTGLIGLSVRSWECSDCGSVHDRDINSAVVILRIGSGRDLKGDSNVSK